MFVVVGVKLDTVSVIRGNKINGMRQGREVQETD